MNRLYQLQRKYGRYSIRNFMMIIVIGQVAVFLANMTLPQGLSHLLTLDTYRILHDLQLWRLLTFVFIPENSNIFLLIISLYFYYFIGKELEDTWGSFIFNVFYLGGMLGVIIAAFINSAIYGGHGYGSSYYLNMSIFFAYALLYPDSEFQLFFIVSVKSKYLAFIGLGLIAYNVFIEARYGNLAGELILVLFSFLNLILFFGKDFINRIRAQQRYRKTREVFRNEMRDFERNRKNNQNGNDPNQPYN